ncbi:MAG: associated Golgi protein-related protein [Solirubrobacterales bacterium]|jgi:membrane protein DedA with SNARE-associated domain|nr:associated Golgi protein-related protein [Solirubrobacterales bacterium]
MFVLGSLSSSAQSAVDQLGALGLFLVMVAEHVFPPIPSELVLPLAGYDVSRGGMSFLTALGASTAGSVVGALILYVLARLGGRPAVLRFQRLLRVDEPALDRAEQRFARRGTWFVLAGRMVPGMRSLVSLPAGLLRMPVSRYVAVTATGSLLWNALLITLGQQLGGRWTDVQAVVAPAATALGLAAVLVGSTLFIVWRRRRLPGPAEG